MKYDFKTVEAKWQKVWEDEDTFHADIDHSKPKFYALVEFPYPSAAGLHVGHPRSYTALDIVARKKRQCGYNVLYPMGWDAFGLPTENFAMKNHIHPAIVTKKNVDHFREQLKALGFSFDWDREINTTDPEYYKWTQWIFLQLYKKGLAYKKEMNVNWCTGCKCVLANEEVVNGVCERCGSEVVHRVKSQWMLKITAYADKLIDGLDGLAVGVSSIASITMLAVALLTDNMAIAITMAALTGACIGFMPYNLNPAKIFMGDTGSLLLGYVLATVSVLGLFKFYAIVTFVVPVLALAVPLSDTLFAFCRRILHGNKQAAQRGRQEIQAKAYRTHCGHGHGRTDPIAFTDPVPTSRPHILGGIGRQCRSHGIRQEPDQHIQLVADAPGRNGVCSHCVHRCLHNGIGHREQHRLQCQRNAEAYHGPQVFQPPPEPPCAEPFRQFFPCHPQCHGRTDHLGKNRCDRRTCGSHPQPAHQQNVSHNVDDRTDQQNIQGTFGISKGTQDTGGHVV